MSLRMIGGWLMCCGCTEVRHRSKHSFSLVAEGVIRTITDPHALGTGTLLTTGVIADSGLNRWPGTTPGHPGATASLNKSDALVLSRKSQSFIYPACIYQSPPKEFNQFASGNKNLEPLSHYAAIDSKDRFSCFDKITHWTTHPIELPTI